VSPRESNPDQLTLLLKGSEAIRMATDAARRFGEAQQLGDDDRARLCIVVEELIANLYDHGGLAEQDEVRLGLARDANGVRVSIVDPGISFDPWSTPQTPESVQRGGGAGVRLIRAWADLISYSPSSEGNHLELLLPVRRGE
jgi:anti-sigma regulatory factor (Ser/Thr protein kinase)